MRWVACGPDERLQHSFACSEQAVRMEPFSNEYLQKEPDREVLIRVAVKATFGNLVLPGNVKFKTCAFVDNVK